MKNKQPSISKTAKISDCLLIKLLLCLKTTKIIYEKSVEFQKYMSNDKISFNRKYINNK